MFDVFFHCGIDLKSETAVMVVVDAMNQIIEKFEDINSLYIIEKLQKTKREFEERGEPSPKCILVVNKMDEIVTAKQKDDLTVAIELLVNKQFPNFFTETFFVSAKTGRGMKELEEWAQSNSLPRTWTFSPSIKTLSSPLQRVSEVIREKVFCFLNQEVPYNVFQENADWHEYPDGGLRVEQVLHVPTSSMMVCHSPSFPFIPLHSPSFSFILLHSPSFPFTLLHSSFQILTKPQIHRRCVWSWNKPNKRQ